MLSTRWTKTKITYEIFVKSTLVLNSLNLFKPLQTSPLHQSLSRYGKLPQFHANFPPREGRKRRRLGVVLISSPPIINRWHRGRVESKNSRISVCVPRAEYSFVRRGSAESNSSPHTRVPGWRRRVDGGQNGKRVGSWVDVFHPI